MIPVTKDQIREAFKEKRRKRLQLLYYYYKDDLFKDDLPAEHLAKVITKDLRMEITARSIYNIKRFYAEPEAASNEQNRRIQNAGEKRSSKEKSNSEEEEVKSPEKKEFIFSGPDYRDNPIDKAFDEYHERMRREEEEKLKNQGK